MSFSSEHPYCTEDPIDVKLRESFCAFLDILGFSKSVLDSFNNGNGDSHFSDFKKAINDLTIELDKERRSIIPDFHDDPSPLPCVWDKIIFSDSIIIGLVSTQDNRLNFWDILWLIQRIHLKLLCENKCFIRGGIGSGKLALGNGTIYGPALIHAHYAESKKAKYPRTILHSDLKNEFIDFWNQLHEVDKRAYYCQLVQDSDGIIFINYLDEIIYGDYDQLDHKTLQLHKNLIVNNIKNNQNNEKILDKYKWAAKYHNGFCDAINHHYEYDNNIKIENIPSLQLIDIDGNKWHKTLDTSWME